MPRKKIDGVIEAVHYVSEGKIDFVRAYERRGAVWSDGLILQRAELTERIRKGKNYFTGSRNIYQGTSLHAKEPVKVQNDHLISGDHPGTYDRLDGVPVF